jgi:hypothetical protein
MAINDYSTVKTLLIYLKNTLNREKIGKFGQHTGSLFAGTVQFLSHVNVCKRN